MKKMKIVFVVGVLLLIASGCTRTQKNIAAGTAIGAVAGHMIGGNTGTIVGAGVGAASGAIISEKK